MWLPPWKRRLIRRNKKKLKQRLERARTLNQPRNTYHPRQGARRTMSSKGLKDVATQTATKGSSPQEDGNTTNAAVQDGKPTPHVPLDELQRKSVAVIDKKPTSIAGYSTDLGTGFEDMTQDDFAVPFVGILQKGSPQVEEENPRNVAGAKAGMFFNNVTNELYEGKTTGIVVIPVHRTRSIIEWIPTDDGGGLVNVFEPDAPEVKAVLAKAGKKFGKLKIGDNNDLVETGQAETSRLEQTDPLYIAAKEFRAVIMAGRAQVDYSGAEHAGGSTDGDDDKFEM
jgi:hypothetical protein